MASLYLNPYPDFNQTLEAGKELVRLIIAGEGTGDLRHTTGVAMTTLVGITAIYPGVPGFAGTALSTDQRDQLRRLEAELSNALRRRGAAAPADSSKPEQPELAPNVAGQENAVRERPPIPAGLPKAPPYTPEQFKQLQDAGVIPAAKSQPEQSSTVAVSATDAGAPPKANFDISPYLSLILQLIQELLRGLR